MKCNTCDGTGEVHSHSPLCRDCGGSGVAKLKPIHIHCPDLPPNQLILWRELKVGEVIKEGDEWLDWDTERTAYRWRQTGRAGLKVYGGNRYRRRLWS